jgi:hypothetical protein
MNFNCLLKAALLIAFYVKLSVEIYATNIIQISVTNAKHSQNKSAVILATSPKHLIHLFKHVQVLNKFPIELKFVIYCVGFDPQNFFRFVYYDITELPLMGNAYFLQNYQNNLSLVTINVFSHNHCKKPRYETVDVLDKTSLIWKNDLKVQDKFTNFNGCLLVISNATYFYLSFGKVYSFELDFFELMAQRGNFVSTYQLSSSDLKAKKLVPRKLLNFSYMVWYDVIFLIGPNYISQRNIIHQTTTFDEYEEGFVITPSQSYNSYEKMILPFDAMIWTFLIITFAVAFLSIFIINYASRAIQDMIYGENVTSPALNLVAIFFGIGQTRLPIENFSRIILMVFILFCLIIRTAYQGVQFDMMTRDMRKPLPKTISDLVDMGYVIYHHDLEFIRNNLLGPMSPAERFSFFIVV